MTTRVAASASPESGIHGRALAGFAPASSLQRSPPMRLRLAWTLVAVACQGAYDGPELVPSPVDAGPSEPDAAPVSPPDAPAAPPGVDPNGRLNLLPWD